MSILQQPTWMLVKTIEQGFPNVSLPSIQVNLFGVTMQIYDSYDMYIIKPLIGPNSSPTFQTIHIQPPFICWGLFSKTIILFLLEKANFQQARLWFLLYIIHWRG